MANDLFFKEEGFYIRVDATEEPQGTWAASATFERVSDYAEMKELIQGMRHRIKASFASKDEAVAAAAVFARNKAKAGETGL